jgi:uncharacterized membrane protein
VLARLAAVPRRPLAAALVVAAAALIPYAGSPANGFVLDDHQVLEGNPVVTQGRLLDAFTSPYHGETGSRYRVFRPLPLVTYAVQWAVHGPSPGAFHSVNILLHALAALLAWRLAAALAPGRPVAALAAGLAFAVHAVHTDAVSSIVGRAEVLAAVFVMASFLAFRRYATGGGAGALAGAAVLALLALLSKESAGPLPLFAGLWAVARRGDEAGNRSRAGLVAAWVVAFVVPTALYVGLRQAALGGDLASPGAGYFAAVEPVPALLTLAGIAARCLALLIVPYPLSPDYSYDSIPVASSALEPWTFAGLAVVPAVVAGTTALLSRRGAGDSTRLAASRSAGLGLAWLIVFALPASHVVPLMVPMAERMLYVGSAGACVAVGVGLDASLSRARPVAVAATVAFAAWVTLLAGMTMDRDRVWHDDLALWSDSVAVHPRSALALANLGQALAEDGRASAAVAALERATRVAPWNWHFQAALADLLHDSGLHADEARTLVDAARLARGSPPDLARACAALREVEPAITDRDCAARVRGLPVPTVPAAP